jgi:hypothetical protein
MVRDACQSCVEYFLLVVNTTFRPTRRPKERRIAAPFSEGWDEHVSNSHIQDVYNAYEV